MLLIMVIIPGLPSVTPVEASLEFLMALQGLLLLEFGSWSFVASCLRPVKAPSRLVGF